MSSHLIIIFQNPWVVRDLHALRRLGIRREPTAGSDHHQHHQQHRHQHEQPTEPCKERPDDTVSHISKHFEGPMKKSAALQEVRVHDGFVEETTTYAWTCVHGGTRG